MKIKFKQLKESLIDNVKKAVEIAKKMAGNYTGAVNEIEKIQKGLSKHIRVADALRLANEEAPANATGTAVAGTGDDSSTVVVRKKKEQQSKLMRRIKDSIDKAIPDIKEEDEIRTRTNQLKAMAVKSEGPNDKNIETWSVARMGWGTTKLRPSVDTHIVKTPSGKFKVLRLRGGGHIARVIRPSGKIGGYDDIDGARNHIKTLGKAVRKK